MSATNGSDAMPARQTFRYLAVLDFEATCDQPRTPAPQEIIEFPVVLLDAHAPLHFPTIAEFHTYVRPVHHPTLTPFCTSLTGITQPQVDAAPPFPAVLASFNAFIAHHGLTPDNTLVVTCGDWDLKTMLETQMRRASGWEEERPGVLKRWCNVKKSFSKWRGVQAMGMDGMLRELGLPLVGRHHSGIDDSRNIASIVREMMRAGYVFAPNGFHGAAPAIPASTASPSQPPAPKPPRDPKPKPPAPAPQPKKKAELTLPPPCGDLVDIGANLINKAYPESDLPALLIRARLAGLKHILVTGTSLSVSRQSVALCRRFNAHPDAASFPRLWCTVGVHPHDAERALKNPNLVADLRTLIEGARDVVVAVGECGLDFDRNFSTPATQMQAFRAQAELAMELGMPVFLHERAATEAVLGVLREAAGRWPGTPMRGVIHCFTGETPEIVDAYVGLGLHVGITGWVADMRPGRGEGLAKVVARVPLERLMVETDCPYLVPRNVKPLPRNNEPALLGWVVKAVAERYAVGVEEIARRSTENAVALFGLDRE
ncbi:hypothetical protein HDU96_007170 [Phlyctochytrium bullatum]|nr:hypothetical protein HDU96_007170 [Phlyctochytrium bullatum]